MGSVRQGRAAGAGAADREASQSLPGSTQQDVIGPEHEPAVSVGADPGGGEAEMIRGAPDDRPQVEVVVVESLANLDKVPDSFIFSGFPLNLTGLDGSPIRAVAIC